MKRFKSLPKRAQRLLSAAVCALLVLASLASCGKSQKVDNSWLTDDDVALSIDETFRPVMAELVEAFGLQHPEATMKPVFVSEDSALRLLVQDSVRCCIATRPLSDAEKAVVRSHQLGANTAAFAYDAVALITHLDCPDSVISVDELRDIVSGRITRWEQLAHSVQQGELNLVFDHSGSSTVRYMRDSLCAGEPLRGNVFASDGGTNESVIEMVKRDPTIIGVIGANWLKGDAEEARASFRGMDFRVMNVGRADAPLSKYHKPYQAYLADGTYPLYRTVYVIHTDPRTNSNVRSFYYFAKGQLGQTLITKSSQMLPASPVFIKGVSIKK